MYFRKRRKIVTACVCFAVVLCLTACSANAAVNSEQRQSASLKASDRLETEGFDTPEKAVSMYIEGLRTMELKRMMGAFAVETYAEKYDFEANLERLKAYVPAQDIKLPNANRLAADLNIEGRKTAISNAILRQYLSLSYANLDQASLTGFENEGITAEEFVEHFTRNLESVKLDSLKLLGFIPPEELSEYYSIDANKENMDKQAVVYGADKIESRAAVVELAGEKYLLCMDVVNYGDKWFILNLSGNIGNLLGVDFVKSGVLPGSAWESEWEDLMNPIS